MPLDSAGPQDVSRLWRAPEFDTAFAADRALPALRGTLEGMGIHLDRQPNIELDIDSRPGKIPRAFCAPILVPDRVMLVILPQGGHDDWLALFHEAGHAQHFGHMSRTLPAEDRVRGDNGVTEGWAFLFDHLVTTPAWLGWRVDAPPQDYARFNALYDLHMLRRYCGKLAYELELHSGASPDVLGERYVHHLAGRRSSHRPRPTGWWTSTRCSTAPPTCGRGRSRRRSPGTWRSAGAASGSAAGARACCSASCGSSASHWTPTACCTS